ncbi:MAG: 2Fe-2S iron-sulfur cluster binding domain-containing protein [Chloroflexaceae bacterium]|nr:2Fe-2S iron-sulfur cluster binding domain-containing protein [Chloroflexaceae bacterium]NJO05098.1 2Fe-2S iron-sulfur cluster binding domain-containing protein [Chloroflexaceae bacterium]
MWQTYIQPATLPAALAALRDHAGRAHIIAGGTNLLVSMQHNHTPIDTLIDISRLELEYIRHEHGMLHLGALVTPRDVLVSALCAHHALPLVQACQELGAPQIRNRATLAGNLVNASPAGDLITPLLAMGAAVVLASTEGERVVALHDFYQGPHQTSIAQHELLTEIRFPSLHDNQRGLFFKLGMRQAQIISIVNLALVLTLDDLASSAPLVRAARLAVGCVAPTVRLAEAAAQYLVGQRLTPEVCDEAGRLVQQVAAPISDIHSSAEYRTAVLAPLVAQSLQRIATGQHTADYIAAPVLLASGPAAAPPAAFVDELLLTVNGTQQHLPAAATHKTLLRVLREDLGLTGTKQGCAEGRCGACTVWVNGRAVTSCLVPAPQAHGASITTIEGLAPNDTTLHPLQQAMIEQAGIQCGYCTPGIVMAGASLLAEHPTPTMQQIKRGLSGNICRCTGYQKIFAALQAAAHQQAEEVQS